MTVFFTADQHFGHKNIIEYCKRPFKDVEQMDDALISLWNKVVKPIDTVFVLGDFAFKHPDSYKSLLNGTIHLMDGSHDSYDEKVKLTIVKQKRYFPDNPEYKDITLCHYAMRSWDKSHYGTWHLFGHHHGNLEPYGLSFDIGVDCWNYYPVSIDQVAQKMSTLKPIIDFSLH
jgi:calcineurin-like phosphoesterase family protein